jgi:hypothetical protein
VRVRKEFSAACQRSGSWKADTPEILRCVVFHKLDSVAANSVDGAY